ncbi:hypothetical protein MPSEU_001099500 [Mayamaea pseudoterrestris]|nr:hypothetical protein MPSEU_001099500 [Mayamaea pseudoterrestris]
MTAATPIAPACAKAVEHDADDASSSNHAIWFSVKLLAAALLMFHAYSSDIASDWLFPSSSSSALPSYTSRRLTALEGGDSVPFYMEHLMQDLESRKKLFEETPPEEVKYWFEYTGPLQKYFYRFSKSRGKADYFEGRDDSGVVSARFMPDPGANEEYRKFFLEAAANNDSAAAAATLRLLENCIAMGSPTRPNTGKGTIWNDWFGSQDSKRSGSLDRCRLLFAINTVGAGRGTTMLWETNPPEIHAELPEVWTSEQETAATHIQRNLQEINSMCKTGLIAARVQMLVCEPIPDKWVEWMDSHLVYCGGKPWPLDKKTTDDVKMEERPSPLQVVVTASVSSADACHDLKSGFMEKRMQDLILAPPYLGGKGSVDPSVKTTHADLVSSDDHDVYIAMRWSSLVTIRSVHAFLQASADIAAAASSPLHQAPIAPEKDASGNPIAPNGPSSPFLVPSFVRVSYVSEENPKVAKWRMHGDFFHPAAWEICKDSFDTTWIPHSLSGAGGINGICYNKDVTSAARSLTQKDTDCGQWWVYFTELQMPMSPEVYANEISPPVVQGGSNFFWMVTERQRREIVKGMTCRNSKKEGCPEFPQAVIPLGDLESFLINFTPNTALGHHHVDGRQPGYSRQEERDSERQRVKERKQLHDQEEIEKALFEYTIYPAALFHKDATIKSARARDEILTKNRDSKVIGPQTIKSSYYDVTITKPREATLGWCQMIARHGLCTLYADYFRVSNDQRCSEACGLAKDWTKIA